MEHDQVHQGGGREEKAEREANPEVLLDNAPAQIAPVGDLI